MTKQLVHHLHLKEIGTMKRLKNMEGLGYMGDDRKAEFLITEELCKVEEAKLKTSGI